MNTRIKEKRNSGMTLIEMMIAIFIFITIMLGSLYLLSQIYKHYGFAMEQGISVSQVQRSTKVIIDEIRRIQQAESGAYPIISADDFDFVCYADADKDGEVERIHYWLENNSIKKGITKPSGIPPSYPAGDQTVITVADYVHNTASQPLFSYFNSDYPADTANNPIATPVAQINQIRMVKLDIYFNLDPLQAPDNIRLESFVEMRNLKDNW
jgi:prepilin-type N-terminal cleavage/methylation domain-containing protein